MSADNILIIEQQDDGSFKAFDRSVENDGTEFKGFPVFEAKNEREAIEKAQAYMRDEIVEYGYYFAFNR